MAIELISVHIPKTAGAALLDALQEAYGVQGVRYEDADRILDPRAPYHVDPVRWTGDAARDIREMPPGVRAIHGHFPTTKYAGAFPEARSIVWLRHPVSRLVSHYCFWRSLPPEVSGHTLHALMRELDLDLLEFARLPMLRDVQSRFLDGVPLETFDFVGIQEHFEDDLEMLRSELGWPPGSVPEANRNPDPGYRDRKRRLRDDPGLIAALTGLNRADMALYERGLVMRAARRGERHPVALAPAAAGAREGAGHRCDDRPPAP